MALASELMGVGIAAPAALALGQQTQLAATAAGTVQTDALLLTGSFVTLATVGSGSGVRLPPAAGQAPIVINNQGSNACAVYPATGEAINAIAANSSFSLTNAKCCVAFPAGNRWILIMGA